MSERLIPTKVGSLKAMVIGEGDARPTAVLWHSLFVDERSWERVIPALSRDRQLVLVTGPGHGKSRDVRRRYDMEDCAEAALQVLQALGVEGRVDWLGNAWGGHVGILFAARHPDRVRTLVAAGTPVHPYPPASRLRTGLLLVLYRLGDFPEISRRLGTECSGGHGSGSRRWGHQPTHGGVSCPLQLLPRSDRSAGSRVRHGSVWFLRP